MGLAAAMDISIAIEEAKFGFTEVRIGVAPAITSAVCLPKIRPADARQASPPGNRILAPAAPSPGLTHAAVPADELDPAYAPAVADLIAPAPAATPPGPSGVGGHCEPSPAAGPRCRRRRRAVRRAPSRPSAAAARRRSAGGS